MTLDDVCRCIDALNAAENRCAEVTTWAGSEEGKACLRAVDEAYVQMARTYVRYQKKLEMEREIEMKAENEGGSGEMEGESAFGQPTVKEETYGPARVESMPAELRHGISGERVLDESSDEEEEIHRMTDELVDGPKRRRTSIDSTDTLVDVPASTVQSGDLPAKQRCESNTVHMVRASRASQAYHVHSRYYRVLSSIRASNPPRLVLFPGKKPTTICPRIQKRVGNRRASQGRRIHIRAIVTNQIWAMKMLTYL